MDTSEITWKCSQTINKFINKPGTTTVSTVTGVRCWNKQSCHGGTLQELSEGVIQLGFQADRRPWEPKVVSHSPAACFGWTNCIESSLKTHLLWKRSCVSTSAFNGKIHLKTSTNPVFPSNIWTCGIQRRRIWEVIKLAQVQCFGPYKLSWWRRLSDSGWTHVPILPRGSVTHRTVLSNRQRSKLIDVSELYIRSEYQEHVEFCAYLCHPVIKWVVWCFSASVSMSRFCKSVNIFWGSTKPEVCVCI